MSHLQLYVDAQSCFEGHVGDIFDATSSESVSLQLSACQSFSGSLRELAYWDFALTPTHISNACNSGLSFIDADCQEDSKHFQRFQLYQVRDGKLPESFNLRGDGKAVSYGVRKNSQTKAHEFFLIDAHSSLEVQRLIGLSMSCYGAKPSPHIEAVPPLTKYTMVMDIVLPSLPTSVKALFRASSDPLSKATVYVNSLGQLGWQTTFGGRAVIKPGKASRIAITVDVDDKKKICGYVDGHLSFQFDVKDSQQQSAPSPFAITESFCLFADSDPASTTGEVALSSLQLRDVSLSAREVRLVGRFGSCDLGDGRSVKQVASSLIQMGYPVHWCTKALIKSGPDLGLDMNRRQASDWIIHNRRQLECEDEHEKNQKAALDLCRMGYSEHQVYHCLGLNHHRYVDVALFSAWMLWQCLAMTLPLPSICSYEKVKRPLGKQLPCKSPRVSPRPLSL